MEKVFPADRHSGVAIAGAAGPAMEMVKLFQLQLEHYEKVEGTPLSLEGKANQLLDDGAAATCRRPCRAWSSCRSSPATTCAAARGGCSATTSPAAATRSGTTWPPARAACTPAPSSSSATGTGMERDDAVDLVRQGAVGGGRRGLRHRRPGPAAGHLPRRGHHHRRGLRARARTTSCADALPTRGGCRGDAAVSQPSTVGQERGRMSMPFYVAPEQVMKDRADYARKGIARGRSLGRRRLRRRHR